MPREPKPYLRKQTQSWYCSIDGRQISLGKEREAAFDKFHRLMANRGLVRQDASTLYELSQLYLDWCEANRKPGTYKKHVYYLESFIDSVGRRLRPSQLRVHHVARWHEKLGVSSTAQNDAVSVVQRMLNWAVENEYLFQNPIAGMRKPRRKRRDVVYTAEQWNAIRKASAPALRDLLEFLYLTGCRPREARILEARHLHGELVIFPADESKEEVDSRVIYLTDSGSDGRRGGPNLSCSFDGASRYDNGQLGVFSHFEEPDIPTRASKTRAWRVEALNKQAHRLIT